MNGDSYRSCLIGYGSRYCLTNPPRCIGRKLETFLIIEFFDGFHKPEIAFLNKVEELHAPADVSLRNRNDKTKVRLGQRSFRVLVAVHHLLCKVDFVVRRKKGDFTDVFEIHLYGIVHADLFDDLFVKFLVLFVIVDYFDFVLFERSVNLVDLSGIGVVSFESVAKRVRTDRSFCFTFFEKRRYNLLKLFFADRHFYPPLIFSEFCRYFGNSPYDFFSFFGVRFCP